MRETAQRIAIYSRKSKFTGKGESIENQIGLCRQYIGSQFGEQAAAEALVYEDEGFSGGTLDRPQFQAMMRDSRSGAFSAIVVYRLDRISRNIGDFAQLIQELNARNVAFVSIREQFDTSSPMGRAMMYIASVFSQLERETIAERIRDNMLELAKTGRWLGGVTPTGYASESVSQATVDGKVKRACRLRVIPEEARLVRRIYAKFLETGSLTGTESFFFQIGCTSKNGKPFTRFTLKGILSNPVYSIADEEARRYWLEQGVHLFSPPEEFDGIHGVMVYNRTLQHPGKAHQLRDRAEWIVAVGRHPGLVSGEDWVRVQSLLERNRSKSYRKPRSHTALLSGLLFCGSCGQGMRAKLSQRAGPEGGRAYSYLCTGKEKSRSRLCGAANPDGNRLDAAVLEALGSLPMDVPLFLARLEQGIRALAASREESDEDLERMRRQAEALRQEIHGLTASLGRAGDGPAQAYIVERLEALHETGSQLAERIREREAQSAPHALSEPEYASLCERLSAFPLLLSHLDTDPKREVVRALAGRVIWDGDSARLYLYGASPGQEPPGEDSK